MTPNPPPTQNAITLDTPRKNPDLDVRSVVLGDIHCKAWYPSFYPEELVGKRLDRLYVCQWCFKYTKDGGAFLGHTQACEVKTQGPPGELIYQHGSHSIYEIDGEEDQLFAQNLSLFAKLFLDNKSVFFDVCSFNYYLLTHTFSSSGPPAPRSNPSVSNLRSQPKRQQIIGFFSKEKMSWDNNNLACILIFPPWQRKGLGKILMGVSYELSRREGRYGGPEKPLSELGRKGYMGFWQARVAREVLGLKAKSTFSVEELARLCWVLPEDVISALTGMGIGEGVALGRKRKDGKTVVSKGKVREWVERCGVDLTPPVAEDGFLMEVDDEEDGMDEEDRGHG